MAFRIITADERPSSASRATAAPRSTPSTDRRLVCKSGNPWGLPAKDRSGRLDVTEPPDLGALIAKTCGRAPAHPANPS
ncbi:MAG: hypothetical protein ACK4TB_17070 [Gemmobacter sp.]